MGVYQVTEEKEYYTKDGFDYCEGEMFRFDKTPQEFINHVRNFNSELAGRFEKIMNDLITKYLS